MDQCWINATLNSTNLYAFLIGWEQTVSRSKMSTGKALWVIDSAWHFLTSFDKPGEGFSYFPSVQGKAKREISNYPLVIEWDWIQSPNVQVLHIMWRGALFAHTVCTAVPVPEAIPRLLKTQCNETGMKKCHYIITNGRMTEEFISVHSVQRRHFLSQHFNSWLN